MKWDSDEIEQLGILISEGISHNQVATKLKRSVSSIKGKAQKEGFKSILNAKIKTQREYERELPEGIKVLEKYIGTLIKIKN